MPVTSSNDAPAAPFDSTTEFTAYTTKALCLADLENAIGGGEAAVHRVLQRLGRTDTSTWTDKGSHIN